MPLASRWRHSRPSAYRAPRPCPGRWSGSVVAERFQGTALSVRVREIIQRCERTQDVTAARID
jgi:hypothetical protein